MPDQMVLAMVRLADAPHVRLVTNIVGCDPELVDFDMPVNVTFEQSDDLWIPLFTPEASA